MATSLLEFLRELLADAGLRSQFENDPQGTLNSHGLGNVSAADLHDGLSLMCDASEHESDHGHGGGHHVAAPQPVHHDQSPIEYLHTYITNNYTIDDHSIDNSIHQNIDNEGGTFNQDIHNVSNSGDNAVVAGDDIDGSTITTGSHNQIGDGNVAGSGNVVGDHNQAVTGNDNTTGFGSGDVSSVGGGVSVGAGGAFSGTGNASTDDHSVSQHDVGNHTTTTSYDDSFNTDTEAHISDDHSYASTTHDSHDQTSHTDVDVSHSYNADV
ncbi:IniB N-terminal domain-containing protein [Pseudonocardia sp. CA-107938]|uniref:IniB N-terminal domain-containing protein n=1 Tax=Pseudonocardia sp. CA-107938 TaxID=3240021 RepID=UPI003D8DA73A